MPPIPHIRTNDRTTDQSYSITRVSITLGLRLTFNPETKRASASTDALMKMGLLPPLPLGSADYGPALSDVHSPLSSIGVYESMTRHLSDICRCARTTAIGLSALFLPLLSPDSHSEDVRIEFQAGPSYMDGHGISAVFVEVMGGQRSVAGSSVSWQPVASLGWLGERDTHHSNNWSRETTSDTSIAAAGARFHVGAAHTWYRPLFFGFELAYNQHSTCTLSSHYEFMSTLGWQGRRFSFQLRHLSNGGLHDPNRGETMALVGIGFPP